jgi:hypothetical protein
MYVICYCRIWDRMGVKGSVGGKEHTKHAFILGEESLFRLLCSKNIGDGPIKCLLLGRKKKSVGALLMN